MLELATLRYVNFVQTTASFFVSKCKCKLQFFVRKTYMITKILDCINSLILVKKKSLALLSLTVAVLKLWQP
jgi:hypothetical protein